MEIKIINEYVETVVQISAANASLTKRFNCQIGSGETIRHIAPLLMICKRLDEIIIRLKT